MTTPILVIEAGGTTMRAGRFNPATHRVDGRREVPIPVLEPGESVAAHRHRVHLAMALLAECVFGGGSPEIVSVAYPGPIDGVGRVLATPTMQPGGEYAAYDLQADLRHIWPAASVHVSNDLTAAGTTYAARGLRDFVILTVGSGIGHKLFVDGRPRVGAGRGGEIGHLRVDHSPTAPVCDCGGTGHLGAVASGRGAVRLWLRELASQPGRADSGRGDPGRADSGRADFARSAPLDGHALARAFHAGDRAATAAVRAAAGHLGHALAAIHLDSGVEDFLIIGGLAQGLGEAYRTLIVAASARECWALGQDWDAMIRFVDAEQNAGLIGAGLIACRAGAGSTGARSTGAGPPTA